MKQLREDEKRFVEHLNRKSNGQIESAIRCTWGLRIGEEFQKFGVQILNDRESGLGDKIFNKVKSEFTR